MQSINPATGQVVRTYPDHTLDDARKRIRATAEAQRSWRETSFDERGVVLRRAATILRKRADDLARLMAAEMGKPVAQGRGEANKCAWVCEYYADHGAEFLAPIPVETDAARSYVAFRPLGVVLGVMPWNFPLWQVFRFAAPTLMAGNAAVLKHASNVPGCAIVIEEIFAEAGLPSGVFATLLVGSALVDDLIAMPEISAVTLTGSTPAGRAVAAAAGRHIKKTVLELGGSDPYVILADADLEATVDACVTGRLINSGQSCIAAKRFVVVRDVADAFTERLVARMASAKIGDPLDESTEVGPLARVDLRDELHQQVMDSVAKGARILTGGEIPPGPGAWYPPTVLADVAPGMPAYDEELFGPVAAVIVAEDVDDAIRIANDTPFGLGGAVFTRDVERGEEIARDRLEAGSAFVNAFVRSDPRLPFGGIKESGYGRELAEFGIREFVNIKTVYVA